jgi:hypothetical protein
MVGDDVVDLGDPEAAPGATHPGFDARVFAAPERAFIAASRAPSRARWWLWAAKEAAYKLARKRDAGARFHPSRSAVVLDPATLCGRVRWPGGEAHVRLRCEGDAVHALAFSDRDDEARVLHGVAVLDGGALPSRAARALAQGRVAARLGLDVSALRVERRDRIPALRLLDGRALDLSLSHHGRFAAFACTLDAGPLARGRLCLPLAGAALAGASR